MRFGVVLLAAGASSRMGQPKLLLPWGKKIILAHLLDQWTALSAEQILAVLERDSSLLPHLGKMDVAINAQPELGMFSSVQCAARWEGWRQDLTHFGITLGDQPHVSDSTLQKT